MTKTEWIVAHCRLFGMVRDEDPGIAEMWADLGRRMGASPDQLMEASFALAATGKAPDFRDSLQRAWVQAVRAEMAKSGPPARDDPPEAPGCRLCDETGRVIVPNPDSLRRGRWTTLAVHCRCPLGLCFRHQSNRTGQGMTLEALEAILPDWPHRMRQHHAEQVAYAEALAAAGAVRTRLQVDLARLVDGVRERSQRS